MNCGQRTSVHTALLQWCKRGGSAIPLCIIYKYDLIVIDDSVRVHFFDPFCLVRRKKQRLSICFMSLERLVDEVQSKGRYCQLEIDIQRSIVLS